MKLEDPVQACFFFNDYMCLIFFFPQQNKRFWNSQKKKILPHWKKSRFYKYKDMLLLTAGCKMSST